jgi:hypothetical protein
MGISKLIAPTLLAVTLGGCAENRDTSLEPSFPALPDPRPIGLTVPRLSLGVGIESGEYGLSWTSTPNSEWYTLQADQVEDFGAPVVVYSGPGTYHQLGSPSDFDFSLFYRVRAERHDSISRWSESLVFP